MKMKLLDFKETNDYPSGSGLEYYNGHVYMAGDDAPDILVMDKKWREVQRIKVFDNFDDRIPKDTKSDLEATTIVYFNETPHLLILGSGSREQHRSKAILLNMESNSFTEHNIESFYSRIKELGIQNLNIESAAVVEDLLILGNRGNMKTGDNQIIITTGEFWNNPTETEIRIIPIELENDTSELSGLTYSEKNDTLFFTATTEDRNSPDDDGKIGESYLGIVENAYRKLYRKKVKVNEQIRLSDVDETFKGHKIESVCIQTDKRGRLKLHLVADNDQGGTFLFKAMVRF